MTRTENEQELVLGNRQLLSAFFVVVALLGVFFAMGYVIGRNTNASPESAKKATQIDRPAESAAIIDTTPPVVSTPPPAVPRTEPAKEEAARPTVKAPVEKPVVDRSPVDTPGGVASVETTAGHSYLQVMAVKRPVADSTVKMLKGHGLPALLGESSKPDLYRVLVGPYNDTESLAKAKTELKKMGFDTFVSK